MTRAEKQRERFQTGSRNTFFKIRADKKYKKNNFGIVCFKCGLESVHGTHLCEKHFIIEKMKPKNKRKFYDKR